MNSSRPSLKIGIDSKLFLDLNFDIHRSDRQRTIHKKKKTVFKNREKDPIFDARTRAGPAITVTILYEK